MDETKERCAHWNNNKFCNKISNFIPAGCNCDRHHTGTMSTIPACHTVVEPLVERPRVGKEG